MILNIQVFFEQKVLFQGTSPKFPVQVIISPLLLEIQALIYT